MNESVDKIRTQLKHAYPLEPLQSAPESVYMLLLGDSKRQYADMLASSHVDPRPEKVQVWTCNAGFRIWRHDLLFVMDDLEGEAHKWPEYGNDLAENARPFITSREYAKWPTASAYPLGLVCSILGLTGMDRYFFNSVPYMLAYACALGVRNIAIFGADYHHPNQVGREADLPNTEWWLGFLRARGVSIQLAPDTTLMSARDVGRPLYGYRFDPRLSLDRAQAQSVSHQGGGGAPVRGVPARADEKRDSNGHVFGGLVKPDDESSMWM